MSETLRRVQTLVVSDDVRISKHGYDELREDDILATDAIEGIAAAVLTGQRAPCASPGGLGRSSQAGPSLRVDYRLSEMIALETLPSVEEHSIELAPLLSFHLRACGRSRVNLIIVCKVCP